MAKEIRDLIEFRYHILNVFLLARDTTCIAIRKALFHLARNPNVGTDLRRTALALGPNPYSSKVLKSFILLKHVLLETTRLQGLYRRVLRTAPRNTFLLLGGGPDGQTPVFVEQGIVVALNLGPFTTIRTPGVRTSTTSKTPALGRSYIRAYADCKRVFQIENKDPIRE